MVIGVAAGVLCYAAVTWLKALCGYDDALDCFGVHAIGGATGAILTGVFAIKEYGGTPGLIEGNAHQVLNQLIGVVIVLTYDAVVSLLLLKLIDSRLGLRVKGDVEIEGLDIALHGEVVQ
jgi:ammonium transporter, Amt family